MPLNVLTLFLAVATSPILGDHMKHSSLVFCLLFSCNVFAETITLVVPDDAFCGVTKFAANFDGSVSVNNPQLQVGGCLYVGPTSPDFNSAGGICSLIGKNSTGSFIQDIFDFGERVVLNSNGSLKGVTQSNYRFTKVICK